MVNRKNEIKSILSQVPLFADIPGEVLHDFALVAEERMVPARDIVFHQGDRGDRFVIIHSGSVKVFMKDTEGLETELAQLGPGDSFGELALLTGEPRAGSVEALEDTHLIIIYKENVYEILERYPDISFIFFKKLYDWLIQSNLKIELQRKRTEYEKLSALGRLMANVAHQIRNPISVIAGFTERLKKSIDPKTKEKEYLDLISSEVKRLEEILKEVLIFSNEPFFKKERCDINKIIDECVDVYIGICNNCSITVNKHCNEVSNIYIDKRYVKYAINHLLRNAIEAMPMGGILTIRTNEGFVHRKNYVIVNIIDTGAGISEDNLPLICEPFFTTKVTKKEIGLGLPITKKIVEGHGGLMKAESVVGKGSTFTLFFPLESRYSHGS